MGATRAKEICSLSIPVDGSADTNEFLPEPDRYVDIPGRATAVCLSFNRFWFIDSVFQCHNTRPDPCPALVVNTTILLEGSNLGCT